ncbi:MAG: mandelate racemase/muconate lactonizing enzyme family protein [Pseudonocardiaceae bacterium]|nr:mandelate racemase/muconate lactonizing enzyme family protein [Pseudonocardiaceae bacterium]
MTVITSVDTATAVVPLDHATAFSSRVVHERAYTLVRVTGDDGVHGIGFCYAGNRGGQLAGLAARDLLGPVLLGADAHLTEASWAAMYQESLLHGRTGAVMRALSALDIALWDRNARAAGLPLHRYLGGYAAESVPAYASGGYYLDGKTPGDLAEEMRGYVAAGFEAVKLKIGRLDLAADTKRLAAVREAVGPDVLVMLDANNAWSDLPTALRAMWRWRDYDPYWIEEPFSPDDIDNHRRLAEQTDVLVATGEIEAGRWRFADLVKQEAAAILQTDAAVCGGISEFRRIAATADSHGVTLCPHWFHDLHAPLVAATPNARYVEFFPDSQVLNFRRLVDRQLETSGGRLMLHSEPGLGFGFDPEAVTKYSVDGWQRSNA